MTTSDRGPRLHKVPLPEGTINVYAGVKVGKALDEVTEDMSPYHGVRLAEVIEAVYKQGIKDGRRDVVEEIDKVMEAPEMRYRNPGRPRKS